MAAIGLTAVPPPKPLTGATEAANRVHAVWEMAAIIPTIPLPGATEAANRMHDHLHSLFDNPSMIVRCYNVGIYRFNNSE